MSDLSKRSAKAAAAIRRSLSSPFGRFFDDPEIDAAYLDAAGCVRDAHALFTLLRESLLPPRETWGLAGPLIRELFRHVKFLQEAMEGECGSDPHRDFIVSGAVASVGPVHELSAHAAALALGQRILDEVWDGAFDWKDARWNDRPWNRLQYFAPDDLDLKPVEENFADVVKHFKTLAPWDVGALLVLLQKETIVTGNARAKEGTPPIARAAHAPAEAATSNVEPREPAGGADDRATDGKPSEPPPAESTPTLPEQTDPVSRAIALMLAADKEGKPINVTDLPRIVGCSRAKLYRDPQFKATVKALKAKKRANIPKGSKTKEGNIEAGYDPEEE